MQKYTQNQKLSTNVPRGTHSSGEFVTKLCTMLPQLDEKVAVRLQKHYHLLLKWNKIHNLTRIISEDDAIEKHYADSLLPLLQIGGVERICDLGSGTGLPGIAAAALWPQSHVFLVETVTKKCSFMRAVAAALSDCDIQVIKGRVEQIEKLNVQICISRATFPWQRVPEFSARHIEENGELMAYIGKEEPNEKQWKSLCDQQGLSQAEIKTYTLAQNKYTRHLGRAVKINK